MKFLKITVASLLVSSASAFSPKTFGVTPKKTATPTVITSNPASHPALWRPPMQMVAGGAEKAYGEEYYDGMCMIVGIYERRAIGLRTGQTLVWSIEPG
jgi:hypothetical protein